MVKRKGCGSRSPLQSALSAVAPLSLQAVGPLHLSELSSQQLQAALRLLLAGPLRRQRRLQVPHTQLPGHPITQRMYISYGSLTHSV